VRERSVGAIAIVEGAGGLFVPLSRDATIADLARELALPVMLAGPDRLGVLSDAIATVAAGRAAGLVIASLVLVEVGAERDPSSRTNRVILAELLGIPVFHVPHASRIVLDASLVSSVLDRAP
jgi:dethiobiotin synthetase